MRAANTAPMKAPEMYTDLDTEAPKFAFQAGEEDALPSFDSKLLHTDMSTFGIIPSA